MNFLNLSQGKLILRDLTLTWNIHIIEIFDFQKCVFTCMRAHTLITHHLTCLIWPIKLINNIMNYNLVATCLHVHLVTFHQGIAFSYHYKVNISVVWFLIWLKIIVNPNFDFYFVFKFDLVLRLGLWISKTSHFLHFNKEFKIDST